MQTLCSAESPPKAACHQLEVTEAFLLHRQPGVEVPSSESPGFPLEENFHRSKILPREAPWGAY